MRSPSPVMRSGSVIEQAVKAQLHMHIARTSTLLELSAFDCGPFMPGIDPLDTSALLDEFVTRTAWA